MKRITTRHIFTAILISVAIAAVVDCCGCASVSDTLRSRMESEMAKLDAAALVDWIPQEESTPSEATAGSAEGDEIDLATVDWYGPDVRGWPVASDMPECYVSGSDIHYPHSMAGKWPAKDGVEGNVWIVVNVGGRWKAASWEWLRPGQTAKPWTNIRADHIKVGAFGDYQIRKGEECYGFVTALARGSARSVPERTAAVKVVWK